MIFLSSFVIRAANILDMSLEMKECDKWIVIIISLWLHLELIDNKTVNQNPSRRNSKIIKLCINLRNVNLMHEWSFTFENDHYDSGKLSLLHIPISVVD